MQEQSGIRQTHNKQQIKDNQTNKEGHTSHIKIINSKHTTGNETNKT